MVRFFERKGEIHPIRSSDGYDERKTHRHQPGHERRAEKRTIRRGKRAAKQQKLPKPDRAEQRRLDAERKAAAKAQKAEERARKLQAKKDAQAARAEAMWRKWEAREEAAKAKAERKKQREAEREARMLEDEAHRERKAAERQRNQAIRHFMSGGPYRLGSGRSRFLGIAPTKGEEEEWREIPRQFRNKRNGVPFDVAVENMRRNAPWLGIDSESDLVDALQKMARR